MTGARQKLVLDLAKDVHAELVRFLRSRLRDPDEAEEVAQATYVRLLESDSDETASIAHARAYIFRTAANLAHDRWRRRVLGEAVLSRAQDLPDFTAREDVTPEDLLLARSRIATLIEALDELPANCRTALLLGRLNGLTHKKIAERLNVSVSMVKKYQRKALAHCYRRLLEKEE